MPYFAWRGINLKGNIRKGIQFARTSSELEDLLFKKEIALINVKSKKVWWAVRVSLQTKIDYFMQIATLLKAGMLLPDALLLIAQQASNIYFASIATEIADQVHEGISFSKSIKSKKIFEPIVMQMAAVGEECGDLTAALEVLVQYLDLREKFKKNLKAALILPLMTFIFFIVVILLMLVIVVPQFSSLFATMHHDLPKSTQRLIAISNFLQSTSFFILVFIAFILAFCFREYKKTLSGKSKIDFVLLKIPFFRPLIINKAMANFFQSMGMLLQGGMPIIRALEITKESVHNSYLKEQMNILEQEINAGDSFATAFARAEYINTQEVISLIKTGQESGKLSNMFCKLGALFQDRLLANLSCINTFLGPLLLIILGLLIAALILALYTPIMSLSYNI